LPEAGNDTGNDAATTTPAWSRWGADGTNTTGGTVHDHNQQPAWTPPTAPLGHHLDGGHHSRPWHHDRHHYGRFDPGHRTHHLLPAGQGRLVPGAADPGRTPLHRPCRSTTAPARCRLTTATGRRSVGAVSGRVPIFRSPRASSTPISPSWS